MLIILVEPISVVLVGGGEICKKLGIGVSRRQKASMVEFCGMNRRSISSCCMTTNSSCMSLFIRPEIKLGS